MIIKPRLWEIPKPDAQVYAVLDEKIHTLQSRLRQIVSTHQCVKFASSLAVEDMLIMDVLAKAALSVEVFMLQTGRLNAETIALAQSIQTHYPKLSFQLYYPKEEAVEAYVQQHGLNAFYESVDARQSCCFVRKVEPLNRALADADAWITGQRQQQSVTRSDLQFAQVDAARQIAKYNPIFDWSEEEVWAYILLHQVPFNALYHEGYPSIGCEPCTMPVKAGEDIRAGRWWWEQKDSKECGLHK